MEKFILTIREDLARINTPSPGTEMMTGRRFYRLTGSPEVSGSAFDVTLQPGN